MGCSSCGSPRAQRVVRFMGVPTVAAPARPVLAGAPTLGGDPAGVVRLATGNGVWLGLLDRDPSKGDPVPPRSFRLGLYLQAEGTVWNKLTTLTDPEVFIVLKNAAGTMIGWAKVAMPRALFGSVYKANVGIGFPAGFRPTRDAVAIEVYRAEWPGVIGRDVSETQLRAEAQKGRSSTLYLCGTAGPFKVPDDPAGADDTYGDPDERLPVLARMAADVKTGLAFVAIAAVAYALAGGRKPSITILDGR